MSRAFVHETFAQRIVFRTGGAAAAVAEEVARIEATRVLAIVAEADVHLAASLFDGLPIVAAFTDVHAHVPMRVAVAARQLATAEDADLLLSVGGGSTTGTAKAVAMELGLPILAVPTTYAGSEATPVWGLTENREKATGIDLRVLPKVVVYDAELSRTLPLTLSVASGLNAVAHCVDSLWAPRSNPLLRASGEEGIRILARGLRSLARDPDALDAREDLLIGAYLAAATFASAGSGLHHKICHVLGGMYDLPHAATHAVVLPHVLGFNAPNDTDAAQRVARALGDGGPLESLDHLYAEVGAPRSLHALGLSRHDLEPVVPAVLRAAPPSNPTPVTAEGIEELLTAAWVGDGSRITQEVTA